MLAKRVPGYLVVNQIRPFCYSHAAYSLRGRIENLGIVASHKQAHESAAKPLLLPSTVRNVGQARIGDEHVSPCDSLGVTMHDEHAILARASTPAANAGIGDYPRDTAIAVHQPPALLRREG